MTDRGKRIGVLCMLIGVVLASLTEAVTGSVLSIARLDMMSDVHASPDEFAFLDFGYTAAKLVGFAAGAWLASSRHLRRALTLSTVVMTLACAIAAFSRDLTVLSLARVIQGGAGGILLVCGQTLLLTSFQRRSQPFIQVIFAIGAVVAPATLAPYLHGWMLDNHSWETVFLSVLPIGATASALLIMSDTETTDQKPLTTPDMRGFLFLTLAAFCVSFVLSQGNRWDWHRDETIATCIALGAAAFLAFVLSAGRTQPRRAQLLNFDVFQDPGFTFGFLASFAAGFALMGSGFLIPSFAISMLRMTPTAAGMLLLPSTVMFVSTLILAAILISRLRLPPVVTVPFGILGLISSMLMLSGSTGGSGMPDMLPAVLLRGASLGLLFLSITLITLLDLNRAVVASGVALFNIGRLFGGLVGVSFLQTFIENETAQNRAVLAAHITPGSVEVLERVVSAAKYLTMNGMEAGAAMKASTLLMGKQVVHQSMLIAFNSAFFAVAAFFLFAAPALIISKIVITKISASR
ncbi:MFS transporter [Rhizobium sp. CECT 9324]|uniref:MFS transporter n=1 Tax=Rhizobium sp. CECT 9324 TaxID=2845820 RepID=UPI001E61B57A|nr:MFS transporter [Rhizobium sp. CECT 9324]CAH0340874.1 Fatty acid resistance protein FarB [Rhizobium sp. CECT 9324]